MDAFCEGFDEDHSEEKTRILNNALHDTFAEIAVDGFTSAHEAYLKLEDRGPGLHLPDKDAYGYLYTIKKGCVTAICFSAMALESFINMLSLCKVSQEFAEAIDRLDPVSKWQITIKVAYQKDLEKGNAPLQLIAKCTRARNGYVHNKPVLSLLEDLKGNTPAISLKDHFLQPAYESLQAMKMSGKWIWENCDPRGPVIGNAALWARVSDQFKKVDERITFSDVYMMLL